MEQQGAMVLLNNAAADLISDQVANKLTAQLNISTMSPQALYPPEFKLTTTKMLKQTITNRNSQTITLSVIQLTSKTRFKIQTKYLLLLS